MKLKERIEVLSELGQRISQKNVENFNSVLQKAIAENSWFTEDSIDRRLNHIATEFLSKEKLAAWTDYYDINEEQRLKIGLILTDSIPLEGFHDVLATFVSGNISLLKYAPKDKVLIPAMLEEMGKIDSRIKDFFVEVDRLKGIDALIASATDSVGAILDNYFAKYPRLIRRPVKSIAVLQENESADDLSDLGKDFFDFYGIGARCLSKIYIPRDFNLSLLFESIVDYANVVHNNQYKNNFDYSYNIYLLGKHPFLTNNFVILREHSDLESRIACVHYEYYQDADDYLRNLQNHSDKIQSIVSSAVIANVNSTPFGTSQYPALNDYLNHKDTMKFLTELTHKK